MFLPSMQRQGIHTTSWASGRSSLLATLYQCAKDNRTIDVCIWLSGHISPSQHLLVACKALVSLSEPRLKCGLGRVLNIYWTITESLGIQSAGD